MLLLPCLAGCLVRGPETIHDADLQASGEWTPANAAARALVGPEWGPLGARPVRLPSLSRKFMSLPGAVETLCGWSYEKRYYHLPALRAWLMLAREQPARLVGEEWQQDLEPRPAPASEDAWELWRRRSDPELRQLPAPEPAPSPVALLR